MSIASRFETAAEVFFDPAFADEDASVDEEQRLAIIGRTLGDDLLYVVRVKHEGDGFASSQRERLRHAKGNL